MPSLVATERLGTPGSLSIKAIADIAASVLSEKTITGLTHNFYRYPARFSPEFARAIISHFTKPKDMVYDPFMGGGTALVEARALGRRAIGTDISSLAVFITKAKTTVYGSSELRHVESWLKSLQARLNMSRPAPRDNEWARAGYQHNINHRSTWHIRKLLELALNQISALCSTGEQRLARCIILRTGQWALDCRESIPSAKEFRLQILHYGKEMLIGADDYAKRVKEADTAARIHEDSNLQFLHRSAIGVEFEDLWQYTPRPNLILTSPPYPGVHVVYHRWQVKGRLETPAPFWIVDNLDGNGGSFYTFGDRRQSGLRKFFACTELAFASLAKIATHNTLVVQLVAFADPTWQLPQYLSCLDRAGFYEISFPKLANNIDGRLWRTVPNRKWYARHSCSAATGQEVVLFHRMRPR